MEAKSSSVLLRELNSYPILFKSMNQLTIDKCLDNKQMVFAPFDAKPLFLFGNELKDYYVILKQEELEKVKNSFSNIINQACNEYYDNNLNVAAFQEILDRIEAHIPYANDSLNKLSSEVPLLAEHVNTFILQNKETMKIANTLITNSQPINSNENGINKKLQESQDLNISIIELRKSRLELCNEFDLLNVTLVNVRKEIEKVEKHISNQKSLLSLYNSSVGSYRSQAKEMLRIPSELPVSDEELIDHLKEHLKLNSVQTSENEMFEFFSRFIELSKDFEASQEVCQTHYHNRDKLELLMVDTALKLKSAELEASSLQSKLNHI